MIKGTVLTWSSRQFICSKDVVPSILYQKFLIYPSFLKITNFLPFKLHSQTYGVFLHSLLTVKCLRKFYECKHSQAMNQNQINGSVWFGMTNRLLQIHSVFLDLWESDSSILYFILYTQDVNYLYFLLSQNCRKVLLNFITSMRTAKICFIIQGTVLNQSFCTFSYMIIALKICEILCTEKRKQTYYIFRFNIHLNRSTDVFMKIVSVLFSRYFIMTPKKSIL